MNKVPLKNIPSSIPKFKKIRANSRSIAADIFVEIFFNHIPLDVAFENAQKLNTLEARDRGFCHAIVRASLRNYGWLDLALQSQLKKTLPQNAHIVYALLITALAQKLVLKIPLHAVVSETVNLAKNNTKTAHMAGLMNAVLRRAEYPNTTALQNWPKWLQISWTDSYGVETAEKIALSSMIEPPLDIALCDNTPKNQSFWADKLNGLVTSTGTIRIQNPGKIELLEGYQDGKWWVQDMAARIPVMMLGDIKNANVLDLCAAPGGKTAQLIAAGAYVTAIDKEPKRIERLKLNLKRLGFIANIITSDVLQYVSKQKFSHILLDAPCSATGILRKRPDVANNRNPSDIINLSTLQLSLLSHAFSLLETGGILVYATCSLEYEEGEMVLEKFLETNSQAKILTDWAVETLLPYKTSQNFMRCLPTHCVEMGGMDGFFAAKILKT